MNKIIYFFKTTITTSSPPCEKINEKEKTKLLTVHNPMSNKTREIISSPVVLQPTLVHPSIATERRSPNYLIIKIVVTFSILCMYLLV